MSDPFTKPVDIPPREERVTKASRHKMVVEYRRYLVAGLYLRGLSMADIAKEIAAKKPELACNRQTVFRDIETLRGEWVKEAASSTARHRAIQLAKIDQAEKFAWEKLEQGETHREVESEPGADAKAAPVPKKVKVKQRGSQSRWMDIVIKCIHMRCQLLGLYQAESTPQGQDLPVVGIAFLVDRGDDVKEIQGEVIDAEASEPVQGAQSGYEGDGLTRVEGLDSEDTESVEG